MVLFGVVVVLEGVVAAAVAAQQVFVEILLQ